MPPSEPFLPTRRSLLSRLRDWDNHESWREFFETYWKLIYDVARKAGFDDAAAQDVVQETLISVANQMPEFKYDRAAGSFKSWLRQITRRRIADQWRKRYRGGASGQTSLEELPPEIREDVGTADPGWERMWEEEWRTHIAQAACARVKHRVKAVQFQIFDLSVIQSWPLRRVAEALGVSMTQVYLARQRVGALVRKEVRRLETQANSGVD